MDAVGLVDGRVGDGCAGAAGPGDAVVSQAEMEREMAVPEVLVDECALITTRKEDGQDWRSLFGHEIVEASHNAADQTWLAWNKAQKAWLDGLRSDHTRASYGRALKQFFDWARYLFEEDKRVWPWEVTPIMGLEYNRWLKSEGKALSRKSALTGGRAPWEQQPERRWPDWTRWEDGEGCVFLRQVIRDASLVEGARIEERGSDDDIKEVRVTERGGLAISSVNVQLAALSSFYHYVAHSYIAPLPSGQVVSLWAADRINPFNASLIERFQPPEQAAIFPTTEELQAMLGLINLKTVTGKRDMALFVTFVTTCRRCEELLPMKWGDIEHTPLPDGDYIYKFRVLKKRKEVIKRATLKKYCYRFIVDYLEAVGRLATMADDDYIWLALFPERALRLQPGLDLEKLRTQPVSSHTVNRTLKKYARRAGVDQAKAHLHALRHAGARLLYDVLERSGNPNPLILKDKLIHGGLGTTMKYISQNFEKPVDPGGEEAALELLRGIERQRRKKKPVQGQLL